MPSPSVRPLAPGLTLVDHGFQGTAGVIASFLLADGDDLALIETGPGSTLPALTAGIEAAGYDVAQLTHVLVTHIHLDHAGAAGAVLERAPRARFYVHPVGAPHMIDPSRLLASATRIYGDDMDRLWGSMLPIPAERLTALDDGDTVRVGRRRLAALHTPGHANHHIAFHDLESGAAFTGDVAGVRLDALAYVRPPTPPPDIDLAAWRRSVARLRDAAPRQLCLTHFGVFDDVEWHLDELLSRLHYWTGVLDAQLATTPADALVAPLAERGAAEVRAAGGGDAAVHGYELATPSHMTVTGIARWLRQRDKLAAH